MKKFLSAVLASSMVLAAAPTVYAEDSIPMIDPLGNIYVLGDDNILTLSTDHEIHHGENFYVMLVDQSTGLPTEVRRDDADDMRIYTDWEEGESRVTDDDIVYKKAKDVEVESTIPPTYRVNITLNVNGTNKVVNDVVRADGTGWTMDEYNSGSYDNEMLELATEKYIFENASDFEALVLTSQFDLVERPYIYGDYVYESEAEFLAHNHGTIREVSSGYVGYPATIPTLYIPAANIDSYLSTQLNYTSVVLGTPIYKWNNLYYQEEIHAEAALVTALSTGASRVVNTLTMSSSGRVFEGNYFPGFTEVPDEEHFYLTGGDPDNQINGEIIHEFVRAVDAIGTVDIASAEVFSFGELTNQTRVYAELDYVNSNDAVKIVVNPADAAPTGRLDNLLTGANAIGSGFFVKAPYDEVELGNYYRYYEDAADLAFFTEYNYVGINNQTNIRSGDVYIVGTAHHTLPADGSYYKNTEPHTYFANQDALISSYNNGANAITPVTTGLYAPGAAGSTGPVNYITDLNSFYSTNIGSFFTAVMDTTVNISVPQHIITLDETQTDVWRELTGYERVSENEKSAALTNAENAISMVTKAVGVQIPSEFVTGLATLSGEDYYYFAEFETRAYMGENEYDVVGFVSVGRSRSDAEDRGSTSVYMTLTAGEYEDGEPQGGDIHIEGEYDAVVEFEEDSGEVYITWGSDAMFVVDIGNQDDLNLGYNTDWDEDLADRHGYANIDFLNFVARPRFNRSGDFYIYADEDAFIYEVDEDGYIEHVDKAEWDSEEEAWTFRTNTLESYLITDEELVITEKDGTILEPETDDVETATPTVGKPNPGTGK